MSDCMQGPGYTAIAPSHMYGRAKATALPRLASMICIGDAPPIPGCQLYVVQHAVRGDADVAAASKLTLRRHVACAHMSTSHKS